MVSLFSRLTLYPESNKITKVTSVVASNICWKATFNVDFVNEIVDFQKVPEEVKECLYRCYTNLFYIDGVY